MRRVILLIALWAVGFPAAAAEITIDWDAVAYPPLGGYRVRIVQPDTGLLHQIVDVGPGETSLRATGLDGACIDYCLDVRAMDGAGTEGPEAAPVCGIPDPEILDVVHAGNGWRIVGDNFAADVEVFLDGGTTPVPATRIDCGTLEISQMPGQSVVVRNPSDGVGELWAVPFAGYLAPPDAPRVVLLECRDVSGLDVTTVTALSQSTGLNLPIVADSTGGGDDCAGALAEAMTALGARRIHLKTLPLGEDGAGVVHVIRR
jgi:hypothetical protein